MKKNLTISFVYLIAAMVFGVMYREITKWSGFGYAHTVMIACHPHLLVLGCLLFLIITFTLKDDNIMKKPIFKAFMITHTIGLSGTVIMMFIRGLTQVGEAKWNWVISNGIDSMLQGISGVFHITLGVSLVLLFLVYFSFIKKGKEEKAVK